MQSKFEIMCDASSQYKYNELVYYLLKIIPSGRSTIFIRRATEMRRLSRRLPSGAQKP